MAALPTIAETIERGFASISLAGNKTAHGKMFNGGSINRPNADVTIMMVTYGLQWGYEGGAQSEQSLRSTANYVNWLIGILGKKAAILIAGGGGGSVTPIPVGQKFPIRITQDNFSTATFYPNANIIGNNIEIFLNQINRYLEDSEFSVSATGITINVPGFDATANDYLLIIEKVYT